METCTVCHERIFLFYFCGRLVEGRPEEANRREKKFFSSHLSATAARVHFSAPIEIV